MAPLTKRSKQLLKAHPVIQNQTLIEPPIDLNISSTFSNKAVKAKQELMNKINILPEKQIFSTLSKWNQDVARITVSENLPGTTSQFSSYGIVADESTRGSGSVQFRYCT
ncbi:17204_t:CDS:2 [Entrophospora sp. SA101]|nr:17204_t:CDS:2 [Entrophospora sp. SA101]